MKFKDNRWKLHQIFGGIAKKNRTILEGPKIRVRKWSIIHDFFTTGFFSRFAIKIRFDTETICVIISAQTTGGIILEPMSAKKKLHFE